MQRTYDTLLKAERLASALYTTYCEAVGGKAFNGDPLPTWKEFSSDPAKKVQRDAWMEVAVRALNILVYDNV